MGRSLYFTDLEIEKLIDYVSDSVELLGEAEGTREQTAEDMENGLGSAIRKLYKGRRGEKNTFRSHQKIPCDCDLHWKWNCFQGERELCSGADS